jgi:hypothetical protein
MSKRGEGGMDSGAKSSKANTRADTGYKKREIKRTEKRK